MKKILMTLMASMLLLSSTTYAVEVSKTHNPAKQMMTMSKADAQQMFDKSGVDMSKVKILENGEMEKTEGQWWQFVVWGIAFIASGYYAQSQTKNLYNNQNGQRPNYGSGGQMSQ